MLKHKHMHKHKNIKKLRSSYAYAYVYVAAVSSEETKGRDTRCDKSQRRVAATSRLVCTVAATSRLPLFCRCDMSHEFKPV